MNNNMTFGEQKDFQLMREEGTRTVVCYGKVDVDETYAQWREVGMQKKDVPNVGLAEVKAAITADINSRVTDNIINGFPYTIKHGSDEGKNVDAWLSKENQDNIAQLASVKSQLTYPKKYKVGELDGEPVYEEFADGAEIEAFHGMIVGWVNQCLTDGWTEKDGIDWSEYEALFPQPSNESAE